MGENVVRYGGKLEGFGVNGFQDRGKSVVLC